MNEPIGLNHCLVLGALLFVCGAVCMATKRNAIGVLIGVELVLNGANINFVAFAHFNPAFEIEGQVFARNGSNPVVGAVVTTSLDGSTATTDSQGRFHLVTNTIVKRGECRDYTITITAAGLPTYSVRGNWGSGVVAGQTFSLSPPGPAMIPSCP